MKQMKKKKDQAKLTKPKVNPELDGFNIEIDSFGEIKSTFEIDKINQFLNKNLEDKKLKGREDLDTDSSHDSKES